MIGNNDILSTDKFLALVSPSIAYIKTDVLQNGGRPIVWRGRRHGLRAAPVWITGHSDNGITASLYERFATQTAEWYTVNKEFRDPRLHSIPLGITNDCADSPSHRILGNTDIMMEVMVEPKQIVNRVYMNISIPTYPAERQRVFDLFKDKSWVTNEGAVLTLEGRRRFLKQLRNHDFVLCPRGNGVDTHRLWETLYMGSIPIVRRHVAMEDFYDLPICWIDDWPEVTESFLDSEYKRITEASWNLEKLKFSYWKRLIENIFNK